MSPKHVAIIMDGNRRWAKSQNLSLLEGYKKGIENLYITVENFIELKISETEPGARGDTATNVMKPAILENGYELNVPIFINEGDLIRIDTRSGEYADRAAKG